ncbi:type I pantothenate kinase [Fulvimarina sp. MAC3]|uniref:type I pantothenate kinase n=1 Tax=Fulvimarina sp. MAC3 TaxID=3148887 RepID=UPI0031FC65D5
MRERMDQLEPTPFSPYRVFSAEEWSQFRADTPLTLSASELERIRSMNDPVDLDEVTRIYLSLSRLLSAHVEASQVLFEQRQQFLSGNGTGHKTPFVIGIAGSVAVGKSTTARLLQLLLGRWPHSPKVSLVTTDGFLFPNAVLESKGLMHRKGFPESYDVGAILRFLSDIKAGAPRVTAPVYSHFYYDVTPGEQAVVDRPDILIFEGLNVLQVQKMPPDGRAVPFVSDFFDYSIYIDAEEPDIHDWYIDRFMRLRETAFREEDSFFHRYSQIAESAALQKAEALWADINAVNLHENILPTRPRADLILKKGRNHLIERVALRKL